MNKSLFLEAISKLGLSNNQIQSLHKLVESIDSYGFDVDYGTAPTMYYISRPRNALMLNVEPANGYMTFSKLMNDGVNALSRQISGSISAYTYMYDIKGDVSIVETAAYLLNLIKGPACKTLKKSERDALIKAVYQYPLTKMAKKIADFEGTANISVGVSRDNYLIYNLEIYSIAVSYIPELCKEMDQYLYDAPYNVGDANVAAKVVYSGSNNMGNNGKSNQSLVNDLHRMASGIDDIETEDEVENFYNLIVEYVRKCSSVRGMVAILNVLHDGDDVFVDGGWPVDDDVRMNAMSAFAKRWTGLGGDATIEAGNVVYVGGDEVYNFPIDKKIIPMFAIKNGIDISSEVADDADGMNNDDIPYDIPYDMFDDVDDSLTNDDVKHSSTPYASGNTLGDYISAKNNVVELSPEETRKEQQRTLSKMQDAERQREIRRNEERINGLPVSRINPNLSQESNDKREAKFYMIPAVLDRMKDEGFTNLPTPAWITAVSKIISKYNHNANAIDSPEHIRQVVDALENKRVPSEVFQEMRRIKNAINRNQNAQNNHQFKPKRRW